MQEMDTAHADALIQKSGTLLPDGTLMNITPVFGADNNDY
jgi:hypothetical protein